jgi:hypothetical protein
MYPRRSSSTDAPQLSGSLGSLASSGSNSMINTVGEEDLHVSVVDVLKGHYYLCYFAFVAASIDP